MSRHDTGTKAFSFERVVWEIQRAFYSFKNSPVLALLLMQAAAFIFVQAKGAGKIYLDMIGILLAITLLSWFFTSVIHGNKKIVIYTLLLLTVGTMLQCIFKEEQVLKNPQYYATHNPATSLQFQYILGFVMALLAAFIYVNSRNIASIKCLKRFKLSTIKVCRIFFWFSLLLSAATLVLAKSVGNVRNWITIGGVSLQTTEFIKFLYVFIAAGLLGTKANPDKENIRAFYTVTFLEVLFLALQSEFGTMLLILMLFLTFLFLFVPD